MADTDTRRTHQIIPFPSGNIFFARAEAEGGTGKWQRDGDSGGMRQQTDGKVNIPRVEIFKSHASLDFIAPIGIPASSVSMSVSLRLCVHLLKRVQQTTVPSKHEM